MMGMEPEAAKEPDSILKVYSDSAWMYFKSKPLCEQKLYNALKQQQIPCYLPMVRKTTAYARWTNTRMVPMFGGGYVFASVAPHGYDLVGINRYLTKVYYLSEGDSAALLKDLLVVRKYEILAQKHKVEVLPDMRIGETVVITGGCFKGEAGRIERFENHDSVTIRLHTLAAAMKVDLPIDFVMKEE